MGKELEISRQLLEARPDLESWDNQIRRETAAKAALLLQNEGPAHMNDAMWAEMVFNVIDPGLSSVRPTQRVIQLAGEAIPLNVVRYALSREGLAVPNPNIPLQDPHVLGHDEQMHDGLLRLQRYSRANWLQMVDEATQVQKALIQFYQSGNPEAVDMFRNAAILAGIHLAEQARADVERRIGWRSRPVYQTSEWQPNMSSRLPISFSMDDRGYLYMAREPFNMAEDDMRQERKRYWKEEGQIRREVKEAQRRKAEYQGRPNGSRVRLVAQPGREYVTYIGGDVTIPAMMLYAAYKGFKEPRFIDTHFLGRDMNLSFATHTGLPSEWVAGSVEEIDKAIVGASTLIISRTATASNFDMNAAIAVAAECMHADHAHEDPVIIVREPATGDQKKSIRTRASLQSHGFYPVSDAMVTPDGAFSLVYALSQDRRAKQQKNKPALYGNALVYEAPQASSSVRGSRRGAAERVEQPVKRERVQRAH